MGNGVPDTTLKNNANPGPDKMLLNLLIFYKATFNHFSADFIALDAFLA
jgi:hypothetical protein